MDEYLRYRLSETNKLAFGPTYVYHFNHKAPFSITEVNGGGIDKYYGVSHGDDVQYVFPFTKYLGFSSVPTDEDLQMQKQLLKMWYNFARTG